MSLPNKTILDYMGNTPLVKLQRLDTNKFASVYIKLEEFNPGGSIKSRVALEMITVAEEKGILQPGSGQILLEATGGNTGIGLAIAAGIKGYKTVFVVPDNFSQEKIQVLKIYGAEVVLSDSRIGNDSHVRLARELLRTHPDYIMLDQFANPSNPYAHYANTAKEILNELPQIDAFVAGVGSGGTISGIGAKIKESFPNAMVVAVQPDGCDVVRGIAVPHKITAIALGILPEIFNVKIVDQAISVSFQDVVACLKNLVAREGLFVGLSSAANILAASRLAEQLGPGKIIVTVAPDSGRSYIDKIMECSEAINNYELM
jgi:cysteine synthase